MGADREGLEKRNISIHTLAVEKDSISLSRAEQLKHATGGAQFVSAEETLNQFRLIKDDNEIRLLKEAAKLADYGVEVGTAALREGISEVEVLAQIEYELKKKGIQGMSFSTMVLFGEKSGQPHGNPGTATLKKVILFYLISVLFLMAIALILQERLHTKPSIRSRRPFTRLCFKRKKPRLRQANPV